MMHAGCQHLSGTFCGLTRRTLEQSNTNRIDDLGAIDEAQWKWLLKGRLKKIESMADLVRMYRKHQPGIAALDRRIALTDRLIDRIVYALYGLTEEESAIVEGRTR